MLLSNVELYGISIIRYMSDIELEHPVYIDFENRFLELNPSIPQDEKRLHSFLVNKNGTPVCIGNPSASDKMLQVFLESINHLTN